MKKILVLAFIALWGMASFAQTTTKAIPTANVKAIKATQSVVIQTNGVCQKCADLFKEKVPFFKGVKDYTYDMTSSKITITYDPNRTNPATLRTEISKLGYDADDVKADAAAREKLPACCRAPKSNNPHQGCPHSHSGCGHQH